MSVRSEKELHIGSWIRFSECRFRRIKEIFLSADDGSLTVEFTDGGCLSWDDPLWGEAEILYPNVPTELRLASLDRFGIYNVHPARYDVLNFLRILRADIATLRAAGVEEADE